MSLNKHLLLIAIGLAVGLAAGYTNQARQAAVANPPDTKASENGFSNTISRHTDAANNVVCYTTHNGFGGFNISCVKLD